MASKSGIPRLIVNKKLAVDEHKNNVHENKIEAEVNSNVVDKPPNCENIDPPCTSKSNVTHDRPSKPTHIVLVDVSGKVAKCTTHLQRVQPKLQDDRASAHTKNVKKKGVSSSDITKISATLASAVSSDVPKMAKDSEKLKTVNTKAATSSINKPDAQNIGNCGTTANTQDDASGKDIVCSAILQEAIDGESKDEMKTRPSNKVQSCKKIKTNDSRRSLKGPIHDARKSLKLPSHMRMVKENKATESHRDPMRLLPELDKTKNNALHKQDEIHGKEISYKIDRENLVKDYEEVVKEKEEYKQKISALKSTLERNGIDPVRLETISLDQDMLSAKREEAMKAAMALKDILVMTTQQNTDIISAMSAIVESCRTIEDGPTSSEDS